jgi:D-3-phosphoglycerate dehydrogenase
MRILIASAIDPDSIERLSRDHAVTFAPGLSEDELLEKIPDKDVLVFRSGVSITRDVLRVARNLRLIVRAGSGLDNIDLDELRRRNIVMVRIPRPSAQAVAELTFTLMLGLARNLLIADSEWRQGHWVKNDLQNYLIHGKTLGVVGVGNIGQRVGEMGVAWGMRVIGCVHHWSRETSDRLGKLGIELRSFDEVVPEADFLTLHVPLYESTRHMVDADVLSRMKKGSYLVNLARGGVVDEKALYDALTRGERLRGAGLDVHANEGHGRLSPFRDLPNVILTPHVGASTVDTQREIGREMLAIVERFESETCNAEIAATGT